MREYGNALHFSGPEEVDEQRAQSLMNSLEHNYEATKEMNPSWGLPPWNWDKIEILKTMPVQAYEWLPCEHGDDEGEPLYNTCEVEGCPGCIQGEPIPGIFEHGWGWHVILDD